MKRVQQITFVGLKKEDRERIIDTLEENKSQEAFAFAKRLQRLSLKTETCVECLKEVKDNKRNKETEISGLCIPCQDLYFGGSK